MSGRCWLYAEWLEYNPEGYFTWKKSPRYGILTGDRAGYVNKTTGYEMICIRSLGGPKLTHRLVYEYYYGESPSLIDHINQNRLDNRIENLRSSNKSLNGHNSSFVTGRIPYRGVSFDKRRQKFCSYFKNQGKRVFLGYFNTAKEAASAYAAKRKEVVCYG